MTLTGGAAQLEAVRLPGQDIMSPRHIVVYPYDPAWVSEFERESRRITQALDDLVVRAHHIGSTAIPGIFAKPIIDMLLEVDDIG